MLTNKLFFLGTFKLSVKSKSLPTVNSAVQTYAFKKGKIQKNLPTFTYFNRPFDKGRLKRLIHWSFTYFGEKKTIDLIELFKTLGYNYATKAGISLSIEDLTIPESKHSLLMDAETELKSTYQDVQKGYITSIEYFAQVIDTWNSTSEQIKKEVITHFKQTDILNPVYMMSFSGARGNISQVRQLVGMRGLMSDPSGNIIDFPIQSNFREGLTLTEYIISCYGARKGVVDTALRTATSGYLTRRLVDVAQHVIIRGYDCETDQGIHVFDLKIGNKTLLSLKHRLVGRVIAQTISEQKTKKILAYKNQEITMKLAEQLVQTDQPILIRSPLTCQDENQNVCQLCYGWNLSHNRLVPLGETIGIIAAQSIGEPGTQLTMRTFHTGGVFSGDLSSEQIKAPFDGFISFSKAIPGLLVRTTHGKIAFFTKQDGFLTLYSSAFFDKLKPLAAKHKVDTKAQGLQQKESHLQKKGNTSNKNKFVFNESSEKQWFLPAYTLIFVKQNQKIKKSQLLVEMSSSLKKENQSLESFQTIYAQASGEVYFKKGLGLKKNYQSKSEPEEMFKFMTLQREAGRWDRNALQSGFTHIGVGEFWILAVQQQVILKPISTLFIKPGDYIEVNGFIYLYYVLNLLRFGVPIQKPNRLLDSKLWSNLYLYKQGKTFLLCNSNEIQNFDLTCFKKSHYLFNEMNKRFSLCSPFLFYDKSKFEYKSKSRFSKNVDFFWLCKNKENQQNKTFFLNKVQRNKPSYGLMQDFGFKNNLHQKMAFFVNQSAYDVFSFSTKPLGPFDLCKKSQKSKEKSEVKIKNDIFLKWESPFYKNKASLFFKSLLLWTKNQNKKKGSFFFKTNKTELDDFFLNLFLLPKETFHFDTHLKEPKVSFGSKNKIKEPQGPVSFLKKWNKSYYSGFLTYTLLGLDYPLMNPGLTNEISTDLFKNKKRNPLNNLSTEQCLSLYKDGNLNVDGTFSLVSTLNSLSFAPLPPKINHVTNVDVNKMLRYYEKKPILTGMIYVKTFKNLSKKSFNVVYFDQLPAAYDHYFRFQPASFIFLQNEQKKPNNHGFLFKRPPFQKTPCFDFSKIKTNQQIELISEQMKKRKLPFFFESPSPNVFVNKWFVPYFDPWFYSIFDFVVLGSPISNLVKYKQDKIKSKNSKVSVKWAYFRPKRTSNGVSFFLSRFTFVSSSALLNKPDTKLKQTTHSRFIKQNTFIDPWLNETSKPTIFYFTKKNRFIFSTKQPYLKQHDIKKESFSGQKRNKQKDLMKKSFKLKKLNKKSTQFTLVSTSFTSFNWVIWNASFEKTVQMFFLWSMVLKKLNGIGYVSYCLPSNLTSFEKAETKSPLIPKINWALNYFVYSEKGSFFYFFSKKKKDTFSMCSIWCGYHNKTNVLKSNLCLTNIDNKSKEFFQNKKHKAQYFDFIHLIKKASQSQEINISKHPFFLKKTFYNQLIHNLNKKELLLLLFTSYISNFKMEPIIETAFVPHKAKLGRKKKVSFGSKNKFKQTKLKNTKNQKKRNLSKKLQSNKTIASKKQMFKKQKFSENEKLKQKFKQKSKTKKLVIFNSFFKNLKKNSLKPIRFYNSNRNTITLGKPFHFKPIKNKSFVTDIFYFYSLTLFLKPYFVPISFGSSSFLLDSPLRFSDGPKAKKNPWNFILDLTHFHFLTSFCNAQMTTQVLESRHFSSLSLSEITQQLILSYGQQINSILKRDNFLTFDFSNDVEKKSFALCSPFIFTSTADFTFYSSLKKRKTLNILSNKMGNRVLQKYKKLKKQNKIPPKHKNANINRILKKSKQTNKTQWFCSVYDRFDKKDYSKKDWLFLTSTKQMNPTYHKTILSSGHQMTPFLFENAYVLNTIACSFKNPLTSYMPDSWSFCLPTLCSRSFLTFINKKRFKPLFISSPSRFLHKRMQKNKLKESNVYFNVQSTQKFFYSELLKKEPKTRFLHFLSFISFFHFMTASKETLVKFEKTSSLFLGSHLSLPVHFDESKGSAFIMHQLPYVIYPHLQNHKKGKNNIASKKVQKKENHLDRTTVCSLFLYFHFKSINIKLKPIKTKKPSLLNRKKDQLQVIQFYTRLILLKTSLGFRKIPVNHRVSSFIWPSLVSKKTKFFYTLFRKWQNLGYFYETKTFKQNVQKKRYRSFLVKTEKLFLNVHTRYQPKLLINKIQYQTDLSSERLLLTKKFTEQSTKKKQFTSPVYLTFFLAPYHFIFSKKNHEIHLRKPSDFTSLIKTESGCFVTKTLRQHVLVSQWMLNSSLFRSISTSTLSSTSSSMASSTSTTLLLPCNEKKGYTKTNIKKMDVKNKKMEKKKKFNLRYPFIQKSVLFDVLTTVSYSNNRNSSFESSLIKKQPLFSSLQKQKASTSSFYFSLPLCKTFSSTVIDLVKLKLTSSFVLVSSFNLETKTKLLAPQVDTKAKKVSRLKEGLKKSLTTAMMQKQQKQNTNVKKRKPFCFATTTKSKLLKQSQIKNRNVPKLKNIQSKFPYLYYKHLLDDGLFDRQNEASLLRFSNYSKFFYFTKQNHFFINRSHYSFYLHGYFQKHQKDSANNHCLNDFDQHFLFLNSPWLFKLRCLEHKIQTLSIKYKNVFYSVSRLKNNPPTLSFATKPLALASALPPTHKVDTKTLSSKAQDQTKTAKSPFNGEVLTLNQPEQKSYAISSRDFKKDLKTVYYLTSKDLVTYLMEDSLHENLFLGDFVSFGQLITKKCVIDQPGQILFLGRHKMVLRKADVYLLPYGAGCYLKHGNFVNAQTPLLTLTYKNLKTEDIIQGIPKIEQLFEARGSYIQGSNLNRLLNEKFITYNQQMLRKDAVKKSVFYIQQYIVNAVQNVYQSQGVNISDKHIEIIVKQMTSKVRITEPGATGFLRDDVVYLNQIEALNQSLGGSWATSQSQGNVEEMQWLLLDEKQTGPGTGAEYEPFILGITKASLEIDGFISAASFQETIKVLTQATLSNKRDFLRGLKENIILGHLLPAGTGFDLFLNLS